MEAFFESTDEIVLVVIVMLYNFTLYFAEKVEDGVVDKGKDDEDGDQFRSVSGNKLNGSD